MSAEINNRSYRQEVLKELIAQLHHGKTVEEVQGKFAEVFGNVSAEEIAQAEQALIAGGLPVAEVQRLCDVHAAVFKGSIEEIHQSVDLSDIPGHPAHTLKAENRALERLMEHLQETLARLPEASAKQALEDGLEKLWEIDRHYTRKENLFFPYLEQNGITAPPKVMWGVDDEIRAQLKEVRQDLRGGELAQVEAKLPPLLTKISDMIFKEENILLPMMLQSLTRDEWKVISNESGELGYCLVDEVPQWTPVEERPSADMPRRRRETPDLITLPTGALKLNELARLLDTLPIDITFVGADDTVKYFSQNAERVFPRTKAIIGREVSNCHPPASVHIVEKLVEDLRAGRKDHEDFWIRMGEKYILIRYFAVRGESGEYLGVLEVTQDIRPIQAIQGEKRLVTEDGGKES